MSAKVTKMGIRGIGAVVAIAVAVACAVVPAGVAVAKTAAVSDSTLPLVVCPTQSGISEPAKHLPRTELAEVPASLSSQLSAYGDNQGEMFVLAPRGWSCQAAVGADASESITVFPKGEPHPGQPWPRTAKAVTTELLPSCVGCYLSQACTFFPSALKTLKADYGSTISCPHRPAADTVTRLSSSVVEFSDPPGVHGTTDPSGGTNPALGVVTYKAASAATTYGSWMEDCTLPTSEHALCGAVLAEFVATWGSSTK
jgi:hypothetical protein